MEEATWYVKQRSQIEESLWRLNQRFRMLQDYRLDIRGLWQDDAASDINSRYFRPHEQDSNEAITALQNHLSTLQEADTEFEIARQHGIEVYRLITEIEKYLDFARQDIARAYSEYNTFVDRNAEVRDALPTIATLINQANNCC